MKKQTKNILGIAGVISTVIGVIGTIPSFLREMYGIAIGSTLLIIIGLVLLAIAFGD